MACTVLAVIKDGAFLLFKGNAFNGKSFPDKESACYSGVFSSVGSIKVVFVSCVIGTGVEAYDTAAFSNVPVDRFTAAVKNIEIYKILLFYNVVSVFRNDEF